MANEPFVENMYIIQGLRHQILKIKGELTIIKYEKTKI